MNRTGFSVSGLLLAVSLVSLSPAVAARLISAGVNDVGWHERCRLIEDQAASCFEEAKFIVVQRREPDALSSGTWRLVRTPNPTGGPDAVSIMQMANASQSDIGLAGLMVRCGKTSFDVLIVLLKPFPPRTHPRVKLATRDSTVEVQATVLSPGVVISLPREAAALVHGPWQSSREVAVEVGEDNDLIRGVISLVGLEPALQLLASNCPPRSMRGSESAC